VSGAQGIGAAQAQYARNGFMQMGQGALVVGKRDASISGGIGTVATTIFADVSQSQLVTNRSPSIIRATLRPETREARSRGVHSGAGELSGCPFLISASGEAPEHAVRPADPRK